MPLPYLSLNRDLPHHGTAGANDLRTLRFRTTQWHPLTESGPRCTGATAAAAWPVSGIAMADGVADIALAAPSSERPRRGARASAGGGATSEVEAPDFTPSLAAASRARLTSS